jgi:hypothetical protein
MNNERPVRLIWNKQKPNYEIKLDSAISEILKSDNRIIEIEIEDYIEKSFCVQLADGFNYEGRSSIYATGLRELKSEIKSIKIGNASE